MKIGAELVNVRAFLPPITDPSIRAHAHWNFGMVRRLLDTRVTLVLEVCR